MVLAMKKYIFFISMCIQILLFISCSSSNTAQNNISNNLYSRKGSNQGIVNSVFYNDGVYVGEGDSKDYGNEIATITISKGKITEVVFQRVNSKGKEIISKYCNKINNGDIRRQLLTDDIKSNIDLLTNEVMKKQSYDISIPTNNKDLLLNWKLAVKRALEKAKK